MKFEDIKAGMKVRDHLGNEYTVTEVEVQRDTLPVQLCCTKLVQPVQVDVDIGFDSVGDTWWVHGNHKYMLNTSDATVQQILRAFGIDHECVRTLTICLNDREEESQDFYVYPKSRLVEFELTCDELSLISQVEPVVADKAVVSTDSLKLGMKLVDSAGQGFILIGYDDKWVHMASMLPVHPIGSCDVCDTGVPVIIRVPLDDEALAGFVPAED